MTMQPWFPDAKLGIFIHYGIYAVDGVPESWSLFSGQVSHADYMRQLDGFTGPPTTRTRGPTCSPAPGPGTRS